MGVNIQLKFTIPNFHCFANVDQNKFSQVIRNLISNALKFCQKPGIVNVEVDVVPVSSYDVLGVFVERRKTFRSVQRLSQVTPITDQNSIAYEHESNIDTDYYLRLTVTDDGAGISVVCAIMILL